nr:lysophospholipid acyltransferase family protein [Candidatus Sigynarchaeota archaeon]
MSSAFRTLLKGALNASMIDMAVAAGRDMLANYNLLDNGEDAFYWWYHLPVRQLFNTYFKLTVHGEENVPVKGPIIFAPNHSSFLDPIVVSASATFKQIHWIGKFEHFVEDPIVKSIFSMWSAIPIHRGKSDKGAMQKAIDILNCKADSGHCIGIFPEGTRTLDGKLGHLHNGAAKLAVTTGATIVPVGMKGMFGVLKKGEMFPKPTKVSVEFGKPVYTSHIKGQQENWNLVTGITAQVEAELRRMLGQENN